jgi:hypothetical protein
MCGFEIRDLADRQWKKEMMNFGREITNPTNSAQSTVNANTTGNSQNMTTDVKFETLGAANFHAW